MRERERGMASERKMEGERERGRVRERERGMVSERKKKGERERGRVS